LVSSSSDIRFWNCSNEFSPKYEAKYSEPAQKMILPRDRRTYRPDVVKDCLKGGTSLALWFSPEQPRS